MRKKRKDGRPSLGGGNNALIIGGGINGPDVNDVTERFRAPVDELSVYDRPLRPEEIRQLGPGRAAGAVALSYLLRRTRRVFAAPGDR